jgi:hypothetical protein
VLPTADVRGWLLLLLSTAVTPWFLSIRPRSLRALLAANDGSPVV